MGIIKLKLGTLFLNSCMHGLQKLQVLELDLKFMVVWKIKFKCLKVGEMFLQVFGFFSSTSNITFFG
jgi:hypothetical protein